MFTPKWISLKEAVDYIHRVEGGLRWVALEHLLQALRDQDVSARYASSLGPVTPTYWIDAARNPVHLRQFDYTEIGVRFEHVQRIWPMALALDPNQIIPTQRGRSATTVPTGEGDKEITQAMCHQANIDPSASVMVPPDNSGGTPVPGDTAASEPPTSGRHDGEAPRFPPIRKTRGPEPKKRSEACAAMVGAIKGRQLSIDDLAGMKQKELSKLYPGAGRTVLVEARKDALRKLGENSGKTPTNDK